MSTPSYYISGSSDSYTTIGTSTFTNQNISVIVSVDGELNPNLVFRYIKRKFGLLEKITLDRRMKKLEQAFNKAMDNGQDALGRKILQELVRETKESCIYAKGIRHFVERESIEKMKHKVKGGHISDTKLENYIRVIPKDVLAKKKSTEGLFDGYVIYHYYNEKLEEKREKKQKMTSEEKNKMKDPILFGYINGTDRLYFIADWEDEYCDLTFDEIIDVVGEQKLTKYPELLVPTPIQK